MVSRAYATGDEGEGGGKEETADKPAAEEEKTDNFLTDVAFEESMRLKMEGLDERGKARGADKASKRKFVLPTELTVPGTEHEYLYRTGVTRGLGDIETGRNHITELRTIEAYKLYGDMERIKRTDFFHLSHAEVRQHARRLIDAGKVTPWAPPKGDHVLRFSWKNFLTPSSQAHDAARKVKLEVHVNDLGLDNIARETLIQLVGPRYNAKTKVLKLVSDNLPLREQNKAYLLDLLTTVVLEAKNAETQMVAMEAVEERTMPCLWPAPQAA